MLIIWCWLSAILVLQILTSMDVTVCVTSIIQINVFNCIAIRLCRTAAAIFFPKFWNDKMNFTRVFVTVSPRRPWDRGCNLIWNDMGIEPLHWTGIEQSFHDILGLRDTLQARMEDIVRWLGTFKGISWLSKDGFQTEWFCFLIQSSISVLRGETNCFRSAVP